VCNAGQFSAEKNRWHHRNTTDKTIATGQTFKQPQTYHKPFPTPTQKWYTLCMGQNYDEEKRRKQFAKQLFTKVSDILVEFMLEDLTKKVDELIDSTEGNLSDQAALHAAVELFQNSQIDFSSIKIEIVEETVN
jgi:hypothetical protein